MPIFKLKPSKLKSTMDADTTASAPPAPIPTLEQVLSVQMQIQQRQYEAQLVAERAASVRTFLDTVNPFRGECTDVVRFIRAIDSVASEISELPHLETILRFEQIRNLLHGRAKCILRDDPPTWEDMKKLIIRSFSDPESLGTLQDRVEVIKFNDSIQRTFSNIQYALMRVLDKITLSSDEPQLKEDRIRHAKERAYRHFRSIIPECCKAAVTGRQCKDIHEAMNVLTEEGLLNETFNYQIPHSPRFNSNQNRRNSPHSPNFNNFHGSNNNRNYNNNQYFDRFRNNGNSGSFRNNHRSGNFSGNSRQPSSQIRNYNGYSNRPMEQSVPRRQITYPQPQVFTRFPQITYPDSGLQRVHEPMETENFCIQASEKRITNYPSSGSKGPNV